MSRPTSGLLPALIGYYERLENDPEQGVAAFGFSVEKIHFLIVLEPDGSLHSFDDNRDQSGKKRIPKPMRVPDGGGRSGVGLKPFFAWDNTGYVLGRDNKGKPDRAAEMFASFRDLHKSFLPELAGDPGFVALCRFLDGWDPAKAESLPNWEEAAGMNVVFKLRARGEYVHESNAVRSAWLRRLTPEAPDERRVLGVSLLSGEREELARLHPQIKGVAGANTTGAAIVSFNLDAFESYGKSQSYNAPVGKLDAFRYATALNRLLADDSRRVRIGDATVVFWTDGSDGVVVEEAIRASLEGIPPGHDPAEHAATVKRVEAFLEAARQGQLEDAIKDPEAPFYILGLSPNASRLNVRYWLIGTARLFAERLLNHLNALEMTGAPPDAPPLTIRRLLFETAREPKDISPQLAGEVARAVLGGLPYPQTLFNAVLRRIRAEASVNHRRAAILKAHLIRNRGEEVSVALNKDHPDEAYQLGRLFAALEKTQEDSSQTKLNSTVKDRFFGAAAATPAVVFPILIKLHSHHLRKMEGDGLRINREKLVAEIIGHVRKYPTHLPLERQGLFYIGYYHQRQAFFTKRIDDEETTNV